jgi:putative transposase
MRTKTGPNKRRSYAYSKKHARRWGRSRISYPASETLEIIRLVEGSHLPVKRTLEKLGVSRPTYYRWNDRYLQCGEAGLEYLKSHPGRVWNRIPDNVR